MSARGGCQHNPLAQEWNILPEPLRVPGLHIFISSLTDKITSPAQSEAGAWSISAEILQKLGAWASFSILDSAKLPVLIYIYLKADASPFWAQPERDISSPEHPLKAGTHLAVPPASHRFVSITIFQGQAGTLFQQSFLFFWGFIIDVSMVPIFSSGLESKQHFNVRIEGTFQLQTHSTKGLWIYK